MSIWRADILSIWARLVNRMMRFVMRDGRLWRYNISVSEMAFSKSMFDL